MAVNFMRASLSFPFFLVAALAMGPEGGLAQVTAGRAGWLVLSVVGSYVVGDALFLASTQLLGVPAALAIASTYPLWSAVAGWAFLGQSVGPAGLLGVVLVVAGVVTVVRRRGVEPTNGERPGGGFRAHSGHTTGVLLAAATSLFWALNTFAIARGGADLPVAGVNTFRMGFAIALMPLARLFLRGRGTPLLVPAAEMRRSWPFFLLESVGGTALFVVGLTHSPLAVAAALTSLAPVLSVPFAFLIGRERIPGRVLAGIVVVTAGIVLLVGFGRA
ncbi:MAG: DMT family transporter [Holophagales bacterium]|nr:DMT family transporter [Holophagales bacterium]